MKPITGFLKTFVEIELLQVSKFSFNQELEAVIKRCSMQAGVHKKCTNFLKHCYKGIHINSFTNNHFLRIDKTRLNVLKPIT